MKVIIVGAGEVGFHIARRLAGENKEVVVIDTSADALRRLAEHIDVQTIQGSGSSPQVLEDAGIKNAEIILAVTDKDDTNLIACFFASALAPDVVKLARIRDEEYTSHKQLISNAITRLESIINPDDEVVDSILRLMSVPGAVEINEFAGGAVKLVGIALGDDSPLHGVKLKNLRSITGEIPIVIAGLVRDDALIVPSGEDRVKQGDIVYFVSAEEDLRGILDRFGVKAAPLRNILIVGGGNIGKALAHELEARPYHVKLIDSDRKRCGELSEKLDKTIVLQGDGTDQELLQEENVDGMDLFISVTGDEESNILSCLLAKRLGAKKTITRINKFEYMPLVQAVGIDHLVCPRLAAVNSILRFIRRGNILSAVSIKGEEAEAIEAVVDTDSELAGKAIKDLGLPKGSLILCSLREDEVVVPRGDSVVRPGDRLILFSMRHNIPRLENKLAVDKGFFQMRWRYTLHVLGALILSLGMSMVLALVWALYYADESIMPFIWSMAVTLGCGLMLLLLFRVPESERGLSHREGMAIVALAWAAAGFFGGLPFLFGGVFPGVEDCFFESFSGFSTTGASVMTDIESVPKGILFWRSLTHWLGGMGIIVLSIAILPFLGVGGMQLYKAEVPGPVPDKLKPRIKDTAMVLWKVYVLFSAVEALLLMFGGMDLFDSLCHTFGTMATGGFSTRNASIAAYDSAYIDWVITVFMIIAGINFSLHYQMLKGKPLALWRDPECRFFCGLFLLFTAIVTMCVFDYNYDSLSDAIRYASFQVASIVTTTGYATADYEIWPMLTQGLLLLCMFVGGSAGSTGGGMKCMRIQLLLKHSYQELFKMIHPRAVSRVKFGNGVVQPETLASIQGFFVLWLGLFVLCGLVVAATGVDITTSFASSLACIGNIGPGIGMVGPTENYAFLPPLAKWALMFSMVLGRLEIYTVVILFVPEFWRKQGGNFRLKLRRSKEIAVKRTTAYRNLIEAEEILLLPVAHDPLCAKIAQQAGFKAISSAGYSNSAAFLGKPDVALMTLTEMVDCTWRIVDAVDIPVMADGDTGHGNVTNVIRTVKQMEKAGAASLFIEDQVFPKRCGHMSGKQVIPLDEMLAKLKAALDARSDPDMVIMARTDALAVEGYDAALERALAFVEAGADMVFVEAPENEEDMARMNQAIGVPTLANMIPGGRTPLMKASRLQELGFAAVAYPTVNTYAVAKVATDLFTRLVKDGDLSGHETCMVDFTTFNSMVGLEEIREAEERYYFGLKSL